jgi:16S rRNA (uracil1498-N3)-methyltransferase
MPANCFFLDDPLVAGTRLFLEEEEFHHAKSVMRIQQGEKVQLVNGKGVEAEGQVESIEKRRISLRVTSAIEHPPKETKLTLAISLLRPAHLDFVIEKGVELGVDQFLLFPAHLSERGASDSLFRRLKALSISALKQSGRMFLPEIVYLDSLSQALLVAPKPILWADISPQAQKTEVALAQQKERKELTIFIGPEGGWSDKEKKLFNQSGPPIWLHDTILRAETAGMIAAYVGYCWLKRLEIHGHGSA